MALMILLVGLFALSYLLWLYNTIQLLRAFRMWFSFVFLKVPSSNQGLNLILQGFAIISIMSDLYRIYNTYSYPYVGGYY